MWAGGGCSDQDEDEDEEGEEQTAAKCLLTVGGLAKPDGKMLETAAMNSLQARRGVDFLRAYEELGFDWGKHLRVAIALAALSGSFEVLKWLQGRAAPMRAEDLSDSLLCLCASSNRAGLEMLSHLISSGAPVDERGRAGMTASMWAARGGRLDFLQTLSAAGANLDLVDDSGRGIEDYARDPDVVSWIHGRQRSTGEASEFGAEAPLAGLVAPSRASPRI